MAKEIIRTDLIVVDEIKNHFYLYFFYPYGKEKDWHDDWVPTEPKVRSNQKDKKVVNLKPLFKNKFNYVINEQKHKLAAANTTVKDAYESIVELINRNEIPERYMPEILEIADPYRKGAIPKRRIQKGEARKPFFLFRIAFKEPIISLLEQKFSDLIQINKLVVLFKSLVEKDKGEDFDKFLDNWIQRLKNEG